VLLAINHFLSTHVRLTIPHPIASRPEARFVYNEIEYSLKVVLVIGNRLKVTHDTSKYTPAITKIRQSK